MASGDTLKVWTAASNEPPSSAAATFDTRNNHLVLEFDDAVAEDAIFGGILPRHYAGGGITALFVWMADTATSNGIVLEGAFERHADDAFSLDADGFATGQNTGDAPAPSATGEVSYDTATFTDGGQIDGLLVGESFRFRVRRLVADGNDDMVGDAQLLRVELRET